MKRYPGRAALLARVGIRTRSTAAAVAVVAIALLVVGAALPLTIERLLVGSVRVAVQVRAHDIAAQVKTQGVTSVYGLLASSVGDATLVQILDEHGSVLASTPDVAGEAAMMPVAASLVTPSTHQRQLAFVDNADYVIAADRAGIGHNASIVLAAQSLAQVKRNARVVALVIYGTLPFLLILVGWATRLAVGRSLRSIEAIRRRVERISATDLHERVPVPVADDEVSQLARTMNSMLDRIELSARVQRRFVADASHELRSPLTSMRTTLDVAQRDGERPADAADASLSHEVDRMSRLVDDLLLLAKMDERGLPLRQEDVDLDDLVQAEGRRLRAHTELDVVVQFLPVRIHGDAGRVAQALRNLLDNAARHAQQQVRLSLAEEATGAVIVVEDDGPGIAEADRARVFERFVRLDEHRGRADGGSGLGLAITSEIVQAHGGSIAVGESDLGGARFELRLPYEVPAVVGGANR